MFPDPALVQRFSADLDELLRPGARLGVAVSGGPDSLALLLLACAARPGLVEAATVDHALRPAAREEAEAVARICEQLELPHSILTARWSEVPQTAIQERARVQRYRLLGYWAEERRLDALATGHHADDQAETLLMRLARGSGVRGLAGMRSRSIAPGSHLPLIRPLLGWRRVELENLGGALSIEAIADPSNLDERFERVRIRSALRDLDWLDPLAVGRSAANLADADNALDWASRNEWKSAASERNGTIAYRPGEAPTEILRRIVARAIRKLATEGEPELRGAELDRLLAKLREGDATTIRGVLCTGGREWHFTTAPARRT